MAIIQLIRATTNDISTISALATTIWNDYYVTFIGQKQVDYMLKMMYSKESITEQFDIKKHRFYIIRNNAEAIGFISIHNEAENEWFLNKFYILQNTATKGIGSLVFKQIIAIIAPKKITLTVNRKNYKSINFYFKNGFKIKEVKDFDIGNGFVMNDFVMEWCG